MTEHTRRTDYVVGFVNYPECLANSMDDEAGFYDTKEGGSEIWLIVPLPTGPDQHPLSVRAASITGFYIGILTHDAVSRNLEPYLPTHKEHNYGIVAPRRPLIDAAICIGGSGRSPFDCQRGEYWQPTFHDLTDEGKTLYRLVAKLYDTDPILAFVLDT